MNDHKARVQDQFGSSATAYVTSATHAGGDDLEQLAAWAETGLYEIALDVATGGGHTALAMAPRYGRVVATDLTRSMLTAAAAHLARQGAPNVSYAVADAEDLPFRSASVALVTCRIAPHHFAAVDRFVAEVARVVQPGGLFLLEDSVAPELPEAVAFLNRMEALRDTTHVRSLRHSEWRELLRSNGLEVERQALFLKVHPFSRWIERARTPPEAIERLLEHARTASTATRAALHIETDGSGDIVSYADHKALFKARRRRF